MDRYTVGTAVWIDPESFGPSDGEATVTEDCEHGYFVSQDGSEWFVTDQEVSPLLAMAG